MFVWINYIFYFIFKYILLYQYSEIYMLSIPSFLICSCSGCMVPLNYVNIVISFHSYQKNLSKSPHISRIFGIYFKNQHIFREKMVTLKKWKIKTLGVIKTLLWCQITCCWYILGNNRKLSSILFFFFFALWQNLGRRGQ